MAAGIPAVEFGPDGAGHHGPEEWVSVSSMARYRRSLVGFVRTLPMWLERPAEPASASASASAAASASGSSSGSDGVREASVVESRSGLTAIDGGLG
jgi:succinyl-diaminopimelate desuccinylase